MNRVDCSTQQPPHYRSIHAAVPSNAPVNDDGFFDAVLESLPVDVYGAMRRAAPGSTSNLVEHLSEGVALVTVNETPLADALVEEPPSAPPPEPPSKRTRWA
jgi:hypothetical protein